MGEWKETHNPYLGIESRFQTRNSLIKCLGEKMLNGAVSTAESLGHKAIDLGSMATRNLRRKTTIFEVGIDDQHNIAA